MSPRKKANKPRATRAPGAELGIAEAERAESYVHPDVDQVSRPEVWRKDRLRDRKPPRTYRIAWGIGDVVEHLLESAPAAEKTRTAPPPLMRAMSGPFISGHE